MANYSITNFLATPQAGDTRLRIYDKSNKLRYTIDPLVAYFYLQVAIVQIKIEDKNDILLDFASASEAALAMAKLNQAKQELTLPDCAGRPGEGVIVFSKSNLNMPALVTLSGVSTLACNSGIIDRPEDSSPVRVFINGIEVNVGGKVYPYDCYFSSDNGVTAKIMGDEKPGDKLYWNGNIANYELDTIDLIDFIYLIKVPI
jgi:hypothetical protein